MSSRCNEAMEYRCGRFCIPARCLDDALLDALREAGTPGTLSFSDLDAVIVIDTIDDRAGMSLWTREDLTCHRLLRPD